MEAFALREYHPGKTGSYWMTTTQAAAALGANPMTVRNHLPTHPAGRRTLLVLRDDVLRAVMGRATDGERAWPRDKGEPDLLEARSRIEDLARQVRERRPRLPKIPTVPPPAR